MAKQPGVALLTIRQILARTHRRLVMFTILLSGVLLMASGWLVIREYSDRNLTLIAHTISYTVEPAMVFGDRDALQQEVASVVDANNVQEVRVYDTNDRLLSIWTQPADRLDRRIAAISAAFLGRSHAEEKVYHAHQWVGTIRIDSSATMSTRYLLSGALISLCCLAITILSTRILARRLDDSVAGPLGRVAAMTHAVRTERAFDRRVPRSQVAEIDRLAVDFNALLAELQGWHLTLTTEKDALEHRANHDSLTGLGNRELFRQHLDDMIRQSVRSGNSFGVSYLDADRFKQVNDRYGHIAGDALLTGVAARLRACLRPGDYAFRLGGDEFAIITRPPIDRHDLNDAVARIEAAMEAAFVLPDGTPVHATLSIGAALYPDDGDSPLDLLRYADQGMYQHKKRKRNEP